MPATHEQVHRMAVGQEPADEIGADEARTAGDEDAAPHASS
jgi:hypothetical protein